jgi:hypothetical protein
MPNQGKLITDGTSAQTLDIPSEKDTHAYKLVQQLTTQQFLPTNETTTKISNLDQSYLNQLSQTNNTPTSTPEDIKRSNQTQKRNRQKQAYDRLRDNHLKYFILATVEQNAELAYVDTTYKVNIISEDILHSICPTWKAKTPTRHTLYLTNKNGKSPYTTEWLDLTLKGCRFSLHTKFLIIPESGFFRLGADLFQKFNISILNHPRGFFQLEIPFPNDATRASLRIPLIHSRNTNQSGFIQSCQMDTTLEDHYPSLRTSSTPYPTETTDTTHKEKCPLHSKLAPAQDTPCAKPNSYKKQLKLDLDNVNINLTLQTPPKTTSKPTVHPTKTSIAKTTHMLSLRTMLTAMELADIITPTQPHIRKKRTRIRTTRRGRQKGPRTVENVL